jgi:NADH-quinone oxidoreductase subunit J
MTTALFFVFAIVAIAAAVMMIAHRNPIYCALFLIITLFALAGLFVLLNAPFIAAVHIIIYAGAIMVLFLFIIMLLNLRSDIAKERPGRWMQFLGILLAAILFVQLGFILQSSDVNFLDESAALGTPVQVGDTHTIGQLLFTQYLFPFEAASVLLLSAIIGSVILARRKVE